MDIPSTDGPANNATLDTSARNDSYTNADSALCRRHPAWKHVPTGQWDDWRWQVRNSLRSVEQIVELVPHSAQEAADLRHLAKLYKTAIPPYYLSLIDPEDPDDPIRRQSLPSTAELDGELDPKRSDPLEEGEDSPIPGLTHRYPDRVLLTLTPVCSMYCRFCTRKRLTLTHKGWDGPKRDELQLIDYVRRHKQIHDVILSGGDPLMLPLKKLRWFLDQLAALHHIDVIRIGTRVPVTLPQRLYDPALVETLHSNEKVWMQLHFNHPREITPEATRAVRALVRAGLPVNNQTVLMRGVNDSVNTMRELVRGLLRISVRPYYLFHCDPVAGASHFRTSIWKGLEIIEGLRGHVSGLGVPTYVVDGLHGAGKIPLSPSYLLSASEDAVILRNYEGLIFRYAPEGRHDVGTYPSQGVSSLLGGCEDPLVPNALPRLRRRAATSRRDKKGA